MPSVSRSCSYGNALVARNCPRGFTCVGLLYCLLGLVLLVLVLFVGVTVKGSQRWLEIQPLRSSLGCEDHRAHGIGVVSTAARAAPSPKHVFLLIMAACTGCAVQPDLGDDSRRWCGLRGTHAGGLVLALFSLWGP